MRPKTGSTWDGLTKNSTLRERWHYRRHGTWPASYLERTVKQYGGAISRGDAELMAGVGKTITKGLRRALR